MLLCVFISAHLTMLGRALAVDIRLLNTQIVTKRNNRLLIYQCHMIQRSFYFLRPNYMVLSLGVHPERVSTPVESEIWPIICISSDCEIVCKLVLITNRKSHRHMDFRLVPKSVILNSIRPLLCVISPNSVAFWGRLRPHGWRRHILSATKI